MKNLRPTSPKRYRIHCKNQWSQRQPRAVDWTHLASHQAQMGSYKADRSSDRGPSNGPDSSGGKCVYNWSTAWSLLRPRSRTDIRRNSPARRRRKPPPRTSSPAGFHGSEQPIPEGIPALAPAFRTTKRRFPGNRRDPESERARKWVSWWNPERRVCGGKALGGKPLCIPQETPWKLREREWRALERKIEQF